MLVFNQEELEVTLFELSLENIRNLNKIRPKQKIAGTQPLSSFSWQLFLAFFVAMVFLIHSCSVDSHKKFKRFIPTILISRALTKFSS